MQQSGEPLLLLCDIASARIAFRIGDCVGTPGSITFAAQWLACTLPYRRFAATLTSASARTARGRCGSLLLHRGGLPPPTPCRSPGAPPI